MIQKLKYRYQFEPEVKVIKKSSPGERTGFRSRHSQMFFKIGVLNNFTNFTKWFCRVICRVLSVLSRF